MKTFDQTVQVTSGSAAAVTATSLRGRPAEEKAAIVAAVREHVWPLVASGRVRPVVDRHVAMADAAEGHRVLEESAHVGKVLLLTGAAPVG